MGFSTDMFSKVVEAAENKPLPVVIWIHGHECTGCDESFIRSGAPLASDVVLSSIALEYDHLLSAAFVLADGSAWRFNHVTKSWQGA